MSEATDYIVPDHESDVPDIGQQGTAYIPPDQLQTIQLIVLSIIFGKLSSIFIVDTNIPEEIRLIPLLILVSLTIIIIGKRSKLVTSVLVFLVLWLFLKLIGIEMASCFYKTTFVKAKEWLLWKLIKLYYL
ncbi:putative membrane protein [Wickerhamomyces ciferrii]|uniref:Membrane protein n=1 Tax=Wickerhamomyces ciferrii (strain ATCC 14091 / BCRC 22168 / CBS 111 / JCM 3599 / NBRC 0793 / NRRL Y-1031 F-60-10) TaxID=1206466 RepID=K0KIR6_WICCF|nr:uncharacterized protein BN7_4689 [Wickerhamomyces ciferrii]CCH45110.1 putative membrane protein [Wickerhamomyces ciferrii]